MNSGEINNILKTESNFLGCFASNNLPKKVKLNEFSLIINTDEKKSKGEHWLGVHVKNNQAFYFDTFGCPILEEPIRKWLVNKTIYWSKKCIQSVSSNMCGFFTICFIKCVYDLKSFEIFLDCFNDTNTDQNDAIISYVIKRLIYSLYFFIFFS